MAQEGKQLLLKDLCARLPYGVKVSFRGKTEVLHEAHIYQSVQTIVGESGILYDVDTPNIKPYLRPMSSMAEEEKEDLKKNYHFYFDDCDDGITNGIYSSQFNRTIYEMIDECDISGIIDWLNAHHFDYRGLIEKGLALEAPDDMYKTK